MAFGCAPERARVTPERPTVCETTGLDRGLPGPLRQGLKAPRRGCLHRLFTQSGGAAARAEKLPRISHLPLNRPERMAQLWYRPLNGDAPGLSFIR
jgi:hypothetical protein